MESKLAVCAQNKEVGRKEKENRKRDFQTYTIRGMTIEEEM